MVEENEYRRHGLLPREQSDLGFEDVEYKEEQYRAMALVLIKDYVN